MAENPGKTNIQYLKGVGEKRARVFQKLGVSSVDALLDFYPRAYEDWGNTVMIADAEENANVCVKATVISAPTSFKSRNNVTVYRFFATDGETVMEVVIFNNRYAAEKVKLGEEYLFFGKVTGNLIKKEMLSPLIEKPQNTVAIRPIYRKAEGLTNKVIESCVKNALLKLDEIKFETLSDEIRNKYGLIDIHSAYYNIHFPKNDEMLKKARRRLVFDELLKFQLGTALLKKDDRKSNNCAIKRNGLKEFKGSLPFKMTNAQEKVIGECLGDMAGTFTMRRLVQGDVGSGKTCVAFALAHTAIKNNFQCAMMAPTEILAKQHFDSAQKMLSPLGVRIEMLLGSTTAKRKKEIKKALADGEIDFIVGTHAIIQNDVEFRNLGLVITDEQHRFGVNQRSALTQKGNNPHVLVMSATPIPRTLALIIYGELDISVIDEMPPGRKKIKTYTIDSSIRQRAFGFVAKHLDEGYQAYIVCPMIDENEDGESELKAAVKYAEELQNGFFKKYRVGLLHGKVKPDEKAKISRDFKDGKIDLLVSTTVIEVGIDVPNAVIMLIENAERFGLSQLHQLRGRVGRGEHESYCILISDAKNQTAEERMRVMRSTNNGFVIADEDLKQRGPGDFFGSKQHGLPEFKIANILEDMDTLRQTKSAAEYIMSRGLNDEKNRPVLEAAREMFDRVGDGGFS